MIRMLLIFASWLVLATVAHAEPARILGAPAVTRADIMLVRHASQTKPDTWMKRVSSLRPLSRNRQIYEVNAFFNAFRYQRDPDRDQTPAEFLRRGEGDCKDFAFAKYLMLRDLNVEGARVIFGKIKKTGEGHAYVIVPLADGSYVGLDNRFREPVIAEILAMEYEPIYVFTGKGVFGNSFKLNDLLEK